MLMLGSAAVAAKTPRNALALSTTIVCEKPKRSQIFMRVAANASVVCSAVGSQIPKAVMPQAAMRYYLESSEFKSAPAE